MVNPYPSEKVIEICEMLSSTLISENLENLHKEMF